jgi:hypothetical protein
VGAQGIKYAIDPVAGEANPRRSRSTLHSGRHMRLRTAHTL